MVAAAAGEKGGGERERFIEREVVVIMRRSLPAYNIVGAVSELGFLKKGKNFGNF